MGDASVAFLGMGLIASATYLLNDLLDLPHDRRHWSKRLRPIAAGELGLAKAATGTPFGMRSASCPQWRRAIFASRSDGTTSR